MRNFAIIFGVTCLSCFQMNAGIMKDLQQEVNEINIELNNPSLTDRQRDILIGKSEGLFYAIELLYHYGIDL